ncbi:uncharacterized protein LOC132704962 [Cylas formicarius]|uniref:uncharacterized protein LOC132704962 n=1 Tax=Cylas formicarius TaxID=197179 RepID=UPI002958CC13|nr:uncharacterized protein LOC132704962 [Cylas formicarius]
MIADERVARSVALEQAYVHDVYEQFYDNPRSKPWPKIRNFLEDLEPGSLICDVGCGNGKYLNINTSIFNIGGEKSTRLGKLAREKENEVIELDNLSLPFRDESLDAVISISVVHHLATTERRVCALRELARVLRIGGRLIITVWAMEQSHRKFESQDVLVPWRKPKHISTPSLELTSTTNTSEDDGLPPYHAYTQTSDSDSSKSFRSKLMLPKKRRGNHHRKGRSIDPGRSSSPSSSSLSSPNETCYSFVRRAIQKLAGGGRRVASHRPWFLESWTTCANRQPPQKRYDPDGCECCECCAENIQDLPIELRRIDDDEPSQPPRRQTFPASQLAADIGSLKSKSMTNIKTAHENNNNIENYLRTQKDGEKNRISSPDHLDETTPKNTLMKPKLVKQKKSVCEEDADEALDQPTDMKNLITALPDFKIFHNRYSRVGVLKQRSLNEDILSTERLREKERLKKNIQKQTSLNEDLIYQRSRTFESIKDSFFSVSTSKKFQLIKSGLTNKIKNSTNMEKVTSTSLKNGFVRMFQNWKSTELVSPTLDEDEPAENTKKVLPQMEEKKDNATESTERRPSKEDGSDSSKDSSLQSDTSVDSEDSFASVIFVPKSDPMSPAGGFQSPGPVSPHFKTSCSSAPQSPRIKQSSCPTSPRIKQTPLTVYSLTKQLSSPKPSTESLSVAFFPVIEKESSALVPAQRNGNRNGNSGSLAEKYSVQQIPKFKRTSLNTPSLNAKNCDSNNSTAPDQSEKSPVEVAPSAEATRSERLKKIRELLSQKPGFGAKSSRSNFPIVLQTSINNGKVESIAKPLPRLLTLELFNPETDDKDSDSSCVSSPDSIDSVISVRSSGQKCSPPPISRNSRFQFPPVKNYKSEGKPMSLLEAAANVANTLDEAVEKVIKSSPRSRRKLPTGDVFSILHRRFSSDTRPLLEDDGNSKSTWNEDCHKHLTQFADKLSEKLLREIDLYQEKHRLTGINIDDPYIHRLSEELHDLSKLSAEIRKQNEYLVRLSVSDNATFLSYPKCSRCKAVAQCTCKTSTSATAWTKNRTKYEVLASLAGENEDSVANARADDILHCSSDANSKNNERKCADRVAGESENDSSGSSSQVSNGGRTGIKKVNSSDSCDSSDKGSSTNSVVSSVTTSINLGPSVDSSTGDLSAESLHSKEGGSGVSSANCGSTASLVSLESRLNPTFKNRLEGSPETLAKSALKRRDRSTLSDASQDSLPSDNVGGEITYHRYYHVFREGELDQLIEKYVENLHIISSYYDHASWCIVAEKVQVWTI